MKAELTSNDLSEGDPAISVEPAHIIGPAGDEQGKDAAKSEREGSR